MIYYDHKLMMIFMMSMTRKLTLKNYYRGYQFLENSVSILSCLIFEIFKISLSFPTVFFIFPILRKVYQFTNLNPNT